MRPNIQHLLWVKPDFFLIAKTSSPQPVSQGSALSDQNDTLTDQRAMDRAIRNHQMSVNPVIVGVHVDYRDSHQLFEMIRGDHIH